MANLASTLSQVATTIQSFYSSITPIQFHIGDFVLPINPAELTITRAGKNITEEVLGKGEINIMRTPGLANFTIESYFPSTYTNIRKLDGDTVDPDGAIGFLLTAWQEKRVLRVVITELQISFDMCIKNFEPNIKAGEHEDRYYKLELQEWVPYGAVKIKPQTNSENKVVSVEIEQQNPDLQNKIKDMPKEISTTSGDTLHDVAKKTMGNGSTWPLIKANNYLKLPSGLENLAGLALTLPQMIGNPLKAGTMIDFTRTYETLKLQMQELYDRNLGALKKEDN